METRKSYNIVHNDEIWKDHIRREILSQTKCPEKWGFLSEIYKELKQNSNKMPQTNKMPAERKEKQDANDTNAKEKMPFPKTSAQIVGWKSASAAKDAYGIPDTRARGKCDVLRVLQWPHEGL